MDLWSEFHGPNAGYVLERYEQFLRDPASVSAEERALFETWDRSGLAPAVEPAQAARPAPAPPMPDLRAARAVFQLVEAIRRYGHVGARLDPLGTPPEGDPSLELSTYGLTEADLRALPAAVVDSPAAEGAADAFEAVQRLRALYSGTLGHDYLQIKDPAARDWLRDAVEAGRFAADLPQDQALALLDRLTEVEVFEHFLQRSFTGKTRFSIEGLDMMIPLLDEIISGAAQAGIHHLLIGMAHRGRLNVLAHILGKPYDQILAEFKDPLRRQVMENEPDGWLGDVKYHAGAARQQAEITLKVQMAPNPSHLEAINPVIEGMARAAGTDAARPGPASFDPSVTLPILIHGDAAFPGQGVVAETLNLYRLRGYTTGGSIHIIANNQIGFTTDPPDSRSTRFASDLAKGFRIPILHVNADDPAACIAAARLAFAFTQQFERDFLIDLIGYRRLGHNEGDEPAFTQPTLYRRIAEHPTVRQLWAKALIERGWITPQQVQAAYDRKMNELQHCLDELDPSALREPIPAPPPPGAARSVPTGVPLERLTELWEHLNRLPEGFKLHPRLERIRQRRAKVLGGDPRWPTVDWAAAEELAFATILADGTPIRLTGQDVERGTFSHRHAVLHDVETGATHLPLHHLPAARAAFEVYNSPLSEAAALGFEFGYNLQAPERLVIWEAQYGDFINNAQTVVDEFIVSARGKWGQLPSLVLLLPHGYEGQGPDHSSARLERFLNLAADNNLRVANCTTAAQYFHLLRRQAALLLKDPLPLVVMTPKSLLRHPLTASAPIEFSEGRWQPVMDRAAPPEGSLPPAENVTRLILCSGKVYVDLITSELQPRHPEVGIARVEQLAPFPLREVQELLARYPKLKAITWVQEEPENMGAWDFVRPYLQKAAGKLPLGLVARPRAASPAEGSNNLHIHNQRRLVEQAYER